MKYLSQIFYIARLEGQYFSRFPKLLIKVQIPIIT